MGELTRGSSHEPRNLVERAADAAMSKIGEELELSDARAVRIFVAIQAEDVPEGEPDCTTAGSGYEDAADLIAELLGHAQGAAKSVGYTLHVVPEIVEPRHG